VKEGEGEEDEDEENVFRVDNFVSPTPFRPKTSANKHGKHLKHRDKTAKLYANNSQNGKPYTTRENKRDLKRLEKQLEKVIQRKSKKDYPVNIRPNSKPSYYQDDTEGHQELKFPQDNPEPNCMIKKVSSLEIWDEPPTSDGKPIMMLDKQNQMAFIKCCAADRICEADWKRLHVHTLQKAMKLHQNMLRGKKKRGKSKKYICSGKRRNPKNTKIGYYAFLKWVNKKTRNNLKLRIRKLVAAVEASALNYLWHSDLNTFAKIREEGNLKDATINGEKGKFTQIAVAQKYWSPLHVDDDIFPTVLSCYSKSCVDSGNKDAILYYFVFPTLNVAVPMRSMDMLVFNSRIPHCATNYRVEDSFILSLFTSSKTANAQMALTEEMKSTSKENTAAETTAPSSRKRELEVEKEPEVAARNGRPKKRRGKLN
jgi:hypothetical protein